jgi:hypothetical protein
LTVGSSNRSSGPVLPKHLGVRLAVRPARVAVFIPDIPKWGMHCARKVIEIMSRTWGGVGNIVVPLCKDGKISEPFWRLLKLFDADYYAVYSPTRRDLQQADPTDFDNHRASHIQAMVNDGFDLSRAEEEVESEYFLNVHCRIDLHDDDKDRILRELAPFCHPDLHLWQLRMNDGPYHGAVDMAALQPIIHERMFLPNADKLNESLGMMLLDRVGALDTECTERFNAERVELGEKHLDQVIEACVLDIEQPRNQGLLSLLYGEHGRNGRPSDASCFPFPCTKLACEWRTTSLTYQFKQPLIVVVGNSLADYCYGASLHRLTGRAIWVADLLEQNDDQLLRSIRERVWRNIKDRMRAIQGEELLVTSLTKSNSELDDLVTSWNEEQMVSLYQIQCRIVEYTHVPIEGVICLLHNRLNNIIRYEPFVNGELQTRIETPIPLDMAEHDPQHVTWFVDASIEGQQLPARSCLNGEITKGSVQELRCSTRGMTYNSHGILTWGGERVENLVQRPKLRYLDALEAFRVLLGRDGLTIRVSEKGQYGQAFLNRFGGLDEAVEVLKDPTLSWILDGFTKARPEPEDNEQEVAREDGPVFLNSVRRWYLTLADMAKIAVSSTTKLRGVVDDWIGRGILSRGLILQCPRCRYAGWYACDDVGHRFRCQRCREDSQIVQDVWKKPIEEPRWYYELREVVYQALKHNVRAPVFALARLKEKTRPFLYAPELEVHFDNGDKAEVDLWAIVDGRIVLGEATSTSTLEENAKKEDRRLKRLCRIAKAATADEVVFATMASEWENSTRKRINKTFEACRVPVRYFENVGD